MDGGRRGGGKFGECEWATEERNESKWVGEGEKGLQGEEKGRMGSRGVG